MSSFASTFCIVQAIKSWKRRKKKNCAVLTFVFVFKINNLIYCKNSRKIKLPNSVRSPKNRS